MIAPDLIQIVVRDVIDFSTRVEDGHVWHASHDGQPLKVQANATFAHRVDWSEHCSFCARVNGAIQHLFADVELYPVLAEVSW